MLELRSLMPFRIREILMVSSAYDAFVLEGDGGLTDRLFVEYSELNLPSAPRITHVTSGERALQLMSERRFDCVLAMSRLEDMDVIPFGRAVKARAPDMPVVLLTYNRAELRRYPGGRCPGTVDRVFLWTGDARILVAIIKLVEDDKNADHDIEAAGVRVIIVVEDSIRYYSSFLSILYESVMTQTQSLIAEGLNPLHKLLRMRARPKIMLATSYEEATALIERCKRHVLAIMSDVCYPRDGEQDDNAGFALVQYAREQIRGLPVLLQSSNLDNRSKAHNLNSAFLDKNAPNVERQVRYFISNNLGFGDFVFRLPNKSEVGRARDVFEMESVLKSVPGESILYHARHNHFSTWLMARSMFELALEFRPLRANEFDGPEEIRRYIIESLRRVRKRAQTRIISDFSASQTGPDNQFVRIGQGSLGGKARGVAFVNGQLAQHALPEHFDNLDITVPRAAVICTSHFDLFLEKNDVPHDGEAPPPDDVILRRFISGDLGQRLRADLVSIWRTFRGPLAVRSSSLLEDQRFQPFSGIYSTYMLPNNHPDDWERFEQLCRAIKAVYASTFFSNGRAYIENTDYSHDEERMAVLIQEMVGQPHGDRFYPHFAGVALSHDYYAMSEQRPGDGVSMIALGLGEQVTGGGSAVRFSPGNPRARAPFASARDMIRGSQTDFFALDLSQPTVDFAAGANPSLKCFDLATAERDGTLQAVGSVYSPEDDIIRDNLNRPGPRVVTFNNVLRWNEIPLAEALSKLLRVLAAGMGCPLEMEFAVDLGDWGRADVAKKHRRKPRLYVLQIRPLATGAALDESLSAERHAPEEVFAWSDQALGHGTIEDVCDIVYVKPSAVDVMNTKLAATEVGEFNTRLQREEVPYMLIGPGRWGSTDPHLGIPVRWSQLSGARIIAETSFRERIVEPSQGTHFFHNITSLAIGYITLERTFNEPGRRFVDLEWLDAQPAHHETATVRHVRLPGPLRITLDGRSRQATLLKPR